VAVGVLVAVAVADGVAVGAMVAVAVTDGVGVDDVVAVGELVVVAVADGVVVAGVVVVGGFVAVADGVGVADVVAVGELVAVVVTVCVVAADGVFVFVGATLELVGSGVAMSAVDVGVGVIGGVRVTDVSVGNTIGVVDGSLPRTMSGRKTATLPVFSCASVTGCHRRTNAATNTSVISRAVKLIFVFALCIKPHSLSVISDSVATAASNRPDRSVRAVRRR
jgi:hypothetical protein